MGIVVRQSIKSTIVNYIGTFIGFITTMFIMTRFLRPEEIGLTRVILEAGLLFSVLAQLGTSASMLRFFPYFRNEKNKDNGFTFYMLAIPAIGCTVFVLLYVLLRSAITGMFIEKSPLFVDYYYWVIPMIVILTYWQVFETYSAVKMRIVVPKFNRDVLLRVLLLSVYLFYGYHLITQRQLVGGFVVVYAVSALATFMYVLRIGRFTLKHDNSFINPPLRRDIGRYTLFLIVGALAETILAKLDLFMVSSGMGLDYSGIYTIAFNMAVVIEIPRRSITGISSPLAAEALKGGDFETANKLYQKVSLHQLLAGGLIFVIIWANIDGIFAVIPNGEIYAQGKWVVLFIGLAKLIEITLNFGGVLINFSKYYYWSLYFTFFIVAIGILTNYLLIPVMGITGAALATTVTCMLTYSVQQWIVLKKVKGNPYTKDTLKTLILLILLTGVGYILPHAGNSWVDIIYRSAVLGILGLAAVYYTRLSPHVNEVVDEVLRYIRIKK